MHPALSPVLAAVAGNGLTVVVFGTVAFSLLMSVAFLLTRGGGSHEDIGAGGFSSEARPEEVFVGGGPTAERAEQEQEVRQMLQARSERRVRRGEEPLDVDAEVRRLLVPEQGSAPADEALTAEVRQLVVARNERRARAGQEPLDVEQEVARTLRELGA